MSLPDLITLTTITASVTRLTTNMHEKMMWITMLHLPLFEHLDRDFDIPENAPFKPSPLMPTEISSFQSFIQLAKHSGQSSNEHLAAPSTPPSKYRKFHATPPYLISDPLE
jgi:hypothetical protein